MRANAIEPAGPEVAPPTLLPARAELRGRHVHHSAQGLEHLVGDADGRQRALFHLVVVVGDLLDLRLGVELGREAPDDVGASKLRAMPEPGQHDRPPPRHAAQRTADVFRDRARG